MRDTDQLTAEQQEYCDTVIEECNATKYRSIHPGLCSECEDCRSAYGVDDAQEFADLHDAGELIDEGGFSWHECDVCGSSLGGDRFAAHGIADDNSVIHYDACVDCLFYLANGDVPERPYE